MFRFFHPWTFWIFWGAFCGLFVVFYDSKWYYLMFLQSTCVTIGYVSPSDYVTFRFTSPLDLLNHFFKLNYWTSLVSNIGFIEVSEEAVGGYSPPQELGKSWPQVGNVPRPADIYSKEVHVFLTKFCNLESRPHQMTCWYEKINKRIKISLIWLLEEKQIFLSKLFNKI